MNAGRSELRDEESPHDLPVHEEAQLGTDSATEVKQTSARPPSDDETTGETRFRRAPYWIAGIAIAVIGSIVNWPYQYVRVSTGMSGSVGSVVDFSASESPLPVMGGWPFRYLISYPNTATNHFSFLALFYDAAIVSLLVAGFLFYLVRRDRRFATAGKRSISIADLLLVTVILAVPFGIWQRLDGQRKRQATLSDELQRVGGRAGLESWVPGILEGHIPEAMVNLFGQVRNVRIESPEPELVKQLVEQRGLRILRIGHGDYDLRLLDRLAGTPHLHDLRISGRVIDGQTIEWIASNRQLETLNLMRTNVSAEALIRLELPNLRRLNLIHSDVVLADLGKPAWSETVRELILPHPDPGDHASVTIQGWPSLQTLSINELDSQTNSVAMQVRLEDLPQLTKLELDVFQKFDLTLRNLPKFKTFKDLDYEWRTRIPRGGTAPGQIWCSRFDAQGLPDFEELYIFGVDLKHFLVRDAPKFRFMGVGAFFRTVSAATYARQLTPETASSLIEGLGKSDGPDLVDLDAVPLADVDLSPLAGNRRLNRVMLSQSGTNIDQWKGLAKMTWLKRLDVKGCPIDSAGVDWILTTFPELEHIAFDSGQAMSGMGMGIGMMSESSLRIIDHAHLETVDLGTTAFWDKIQIVNAPKVRLDLSAQFVEQLEVINAPAVTGLSVQGILPTETKIRGLRDLRFFALGGPQVSDEILDAINDCVTLRTLTLAYPNVTAARLKELENLGSLSTLCMPGSALNDSVIASWRLMRDLQHIDVRDTEVTGTGLKRLLHGKKAQRLWLSRSKITPADLKELKDCIDISELMIAEIGIDAETLGGILSQGLLRRLDLSDSEVTPELLDTLIAQGDSLQYLQLRNCTVDDQKLATLASRNRQLRFELSGSSVSTNLLAQLLSSGRIVDDEEWKQYQTMKGMISAAQSGQEYVPRIPTVIDVDFFAGMKERPVLPSSPPAWADPMGVQLGRLLGNAISNAAPLAREDDSEKDQRVMEEDDADAGRGEETSERIEGETSEETP